MIIFIFFLSFSMHLRQLILDSPQEEMEKIPVRANGKRVNKWRARAPESELCPSFNSGLRVLRNKRIESKKRRPSLR